MREFLSKMTTNIIMFLARQRVCVILSLVVSFMISCGCVTNKMCKTEDECLRSRIDQFYCYLKDRNYDKSWLLLSPEERGKKEEYVDNAKKFRMKISKYKIDSISRIDSKAKVKMVINGIENDTEYISESIDCWSLSSGNWYLKTGGRNAEWQCNER